MAHGGRNPTPIAEHPRLTSRILVVDDDAAVRQMVTVVLSSEGYAVTDVAGAVAALEAIDSAKAFSFHLLITDYEMPDMNGLDLAAAVLAISPGTRLLVISGRPQDRYDDRLARRIGASFLGKPFEPHRLVAMVRALLAPSPSE